MNISRKDSDSLNSVVTITVERKDFATKVEDLLKNYQKTASIPGFRKGYVPIGMIKKQYEKSVIADEVNKILASSERLKDGNRNLVKRKTAEALT